MYNAWQKKRDDWPNKGDRVRAGDWEKWIERKGRRGWRGGGRDGRNVSVEVQSDAVCENSFHPPFFFFFFYTYFHHLCDTNTTNRSVYSLFHCFHIAQLSLDASRLKRRSMLNICTLVCFPSNVIILKKTLVFTSFGFWFDHLVYDFTSFQVARQRTVLAPAPQLSRREVRFDSGFGVVLPWDQAQLVSGLMRVDVCTYCGRHCFN